MRENKHDFSNTNNVEILPTKICEKSKILSIIIYFRSIGPTENFLAALFAFGEGWHNFHHTFPWDYRTAETGVNKINMTANLIDFFARLGLAYDLKSASKDLILKQAKKRGDGTRFVGGHAVVEAHEE